MLLLFCYCCWYILKLVPSFCSPSYPSSSRRVYGRDAQVMGDGRRHNEDAKRLLEVALCTSGKLGVVAYPGKPPTVIDEGFGHFVATVNPLVSRAGEVALSLSSYVSLARSLLFCWCSLSTREALGRLRLLSVSLSRFSAVALCTS